MSDELTVRISPIINEALASAQPGEDLDEALLRALKAHYPEQASMLLSALTQLVEMECKRTGEDRQRALSRLAISDPGPEIRVTVSGGPISKTVTETTVIRVGDKEYGSLAEVPPDIRRGIEDAMRRGTGKAVRTVKVTPKFGCAWSLLGGWLWALMRAPWK